MNSSTMVSPYLTWSAVVFLACLHLMAGKLGRMSETPRSRWLSFGGGLSVAYAMLHLLPDLQMHQKTLEQAAEAHFDFLERHAHLLALAGLSLFYGIERMAKQSRRRAGAPKDTTPVSVFLLSIVAFASYNALIGYLIVGEPGRNTIELAFFTLAIAPHFLANDVGLEQHHRHMYTRLGRWILAAAVVAGAALGSWTRLPEPVTAALVAFLGGGIILNVLKVELPEERESNFWAFACGALVYAILLIAFL